jgi:Mg2+ and Co2+ transporter CorA
VCFVTRARRGRPGQVDCLAKGAEARQERVAEMTRLLTQLKQDMMNRTLYALTLVTFLATPVTLLTGTFGMNFTDMRELVRGGVPGGRA